MGATEFLEIVAQERVSMQVDTPQGGLQSSRIIAHSHC